ncbi:hypothetical protein L2E82_01626 [Cichorium intybus]|uniref:Uncharacterized protein n=1 Tax=Cichorium intybus TaxID=13427 RepID=A0ACB9H065_CICIN|nr:hypothetical protein L2E82_01626 [Cichorium intybus]
MHQLIKEMGREVVHQESPKDPGKRSKLWRHQDCFEVLQDHTGTKRVEGLMLASEMYKEAKSTCSSNESLGKAKHGNDRVWDGFKFIGSLKILNLSHSVELIETPIFDGLPRLESLILKSCARMKLALKVFHEFGIFSTFVPEKQIPSRFMYREGGSQISFVVPSRHDGLRLRGFSLCAMLSPPATNLHAVVEMKVYNLTKDLLWTYEYGFLDFIRKVKKRAWLSFWRCGNLLEVGDKFHARIKIDSGIVVKECCINLIYEDDEEVDGERKEAHHDQMLWTDKMHKDISDYVHIGGRYLFHSLIWIH